MLCTVFEPLMAKSHANTLPKYFTDIWAKNIFLHLNIRQKLAKINPAFPLKASRGVSIAQNNI